VTLERLGYRASTRRAGVPHAAQCTGGAGRGLTMRITINRGTLARTRRPQITPPDIPRRGSRRDRRAFTVRHAPGRRRQRLPRRGRAHLRRPAFWLSGGW
jgi:hypothetical protein